MFLTHLLKSYKRFLYILIDENEKGAWKIQEIDSREKDRKILEEQISSLPVDQKRIAEDILRKIAELEGELEKIQAGEALHKKGVKILESGLGKPGVAEDPEAEPTIDMLNRYKTRLQNILEEKGNILTQLEQLQMDLKGQLDPKKPVVEKKSESINYEEGYLKIFGVTREQLTKGNTTITLKISETQKTYPGIEKKFTVGKLPPEIVSVKEGGKEYTRLDASLRGEFIDSEGNALIAKEGLIITLSSTRAKDTIDKKVAETKEGLDKKDAIDGMISETIRTYGLDEKLLGEKIRGKLEEDVYPDHDDELTKEELTKRITEKYPGEKLKGKVEELLHPYLLEKGVRKIDSSVIDEIAKAESQEEKIKISQEKLQPQMDFAQQNYPSNWAEKLGAVRKTDGEPTRFNQILQAIFGIDFGMRVEDSVGGDSNKIDTVGFAQDMIGSDSSAELGSLSAKYESGTKGSLAINPNDNGKPSFGTYQLRDEALANFAKENGISGNHLELGKDTVFAKNWIAKVNAIGADKFHAIEHAFIKKTHFDVQVANIKSGTGVDITRFPIAIQNVVWSVAVQHGPGRNFIIEEVKSSGLREGDINSMTNFINKLYNRRIQDYGAYKERYNAEKYISLQNLKMGSSPTEGSASIAGGMRSSPVEYGEPNAEGKRTTLCSRTARKNAARVGLSLPSGGSAKEAFQNSGSPGNGFPPRSATNARFADVFLDASPTNAEFGHRVFAFQKTGKWFVLDPYYAIPGCPDRQGPIPAEKYIAHMGGTKGRKFWGAKFY